MFILIFIVNNTNGDNMKNKYRNSDLALESLSEAVLDEDYTYSYEEQDDIKVEVYKIIKESHHYSKGSYIEISFNTYNHMNTIIQLMSKYLTGLIHNLVHKEDPVIVVVGLGNREFSCDAIGPLSLSHINATHHYHISDRHKDHLYDYICIIPDVTAQSGIESALYVESIVKDFNADLVIAIDSLRAFSYEKLCKVIQINDTGIYPGSGIGNHRKGINQESLGIPVIGIGVPTVIHASSLINHVFDMIEGYFHESIKESSDLKIEKRGKYDGRLSVHQRKIILGELGQLSLKQREQLLYEIISPIDMNYILTHKQIDFDIRILSRIISETINNLRNI